MFSPGLESRSGVTVTVVQGPLSRKIFLLGWSWPPSESALRLRVRSSLGNRDLFDPEFRGQWGAVGRAICPVLSPLLGVGGAPVSSGQRKEARSKLEFMIRALQLPEQAGVGCGVVLGSKDPACA